MSGVPPAQSHLSPAVWLRTEAKAWLEAGTSLKERRAVRHLAAIEVVSELIEEVVQAQTQAISSEVVLHQPQQGPQTPAETKAILHNLYSVRKRIQNRPLERGERSLSRPLP